MQNIILIERIGSLNAWIIEFFKDAANHFLSIIRLWECWNLKSSNKKLSTTDVTRTHEIYLVENHIDNLIWCLDSQFLKGIS